MPKTDTDTDRQPALTIAYRALIALNCPTHSEQMAHSIAYHPTLSCAMEYHIISSHPKRTDVLFRFYWYLLSPACKLSQLFVFYFRSILIGGHAPHCNFLISSAASPARMQSWSGWYHRQVRQGSSEGWVCHGCLPNFIRACTWWTAILHSMIEL